MYTQETKTKKTFNFRPLKADTISINSVCKHLKLKVFGSKRNLSLHIPVMLGPQVLAERVIWERTIVSPTLKRPRVEGQSGLGFRV